jgi:MFS transporter, ACS family, tartrate transporter
MSAVAVRPVYRRITWRLVPFLVLLYMVAFLDRVNISFAALTMNRDLHISKTLYGFAAGVFFLSYCLFQVPANMALARVGARRWLSVLMVVWGAVSMATAFVPNAAAYISLRAALGLAECGFYPGVIYYFTFWMPRALRTRVLALFLLAVPLCNILGSPVSAHILLMDRAMGLAGWQWIFLLEGAPAVVLGAAAWLVLADGPASARWLRAEEKAEVENDLKNDDAVQREAGNRSSGWLVAGDSAAYFLWSTGIYGLSFWLPTILVFRGASPLSTGWWATLTFFVGGLAMVWASRQRGFRTLPILFLLAGTGFGAAGLFHSVGGAVASFCLAAVGLLSSLPIFWSVAASRLSGKAAGTAIAIVNSLGALGAFCGPYAMGSLYDHTHRYSAGLWAIAICLDVGAAIMAISIPKPAQTAAS